MAALPDWMLGKSSVNSRKTVEKRKATGRSTKALAKAYRKGKKSGRGYPRWVKNTTSPAVNRTSKLSTGTKVEAYVQLDSYPP